MYKNRKWKYEWRVKKARKYERKVKRYYQFLPMCEDSGKVKMRASCQGKNIC